jgi:superkiller protein 3
VSNAAISIYDHQTNEPSLPVIAALSALAIVMDNEELLEAALAELVKLPIDEQLRQDPALDITYLLAARQTLAVRI